ncbi:hypothetical protein V6N13_138447 [Hibiscus sabdariffa]
MLTGTVLWISICLMAGVAAFNFLLFNSLLWLLYWFILQALNMLLGRSLYFTLFPTPKSYYLTLLITILPGICNITWQSSLGSVAMCIGKLPNLYFPISY